VLWEWVGRIRAHPYREGLSAQFKKKDNKKTTKVALFEVYILPLQEEKNIIL